MAPWIVLWILIQSVLWLTGVPTTRIQVAIEAGTAEIERRVVGEVSEDVVRESIATQRETLAFFQTLALVRDFGLGPLALIVRSIMSAIAFSAVALLLGRRVDFESSLEQSAFVQGFWVLGLAVRTVLSLITGQPEVETSMTLLLPPGIHAAPIWVSLREADFFALMGWMALARGAWNRQQAPLVVAVAIVLVLGITESVLNISFSLLLDGWMRFTLIPEAQGS